MIIKDFINNEWSCKCNEVTVIQEERSGHFYIWLLPRYNWMTVKFGNSLSSIREMMNYSKENLKTKDLQSKMIIKHNVSHIY